jgi:hypothetical protein
VPREETVNDRFAVLDFADPKEAGFQRRFTEWLQNDQTVN